MANPRTLITTAIIVTAIFVSSIPAQAQDLQIPESAKDNPICFAMYTVHNNILKLTAQLYPLKEGSDTTLRLQARKLGKWKTVAETEIVNPGWTAPFRVENWDSSKDIKYRVAYGDSAFYSGTIKKDPINKNEIVVAAFTGNSIKAGHGGDIPRTDLVKNIQRIKPDLLFFSGDQVYSHTEHYKFWIRFGQDFGDIIRNIPTVAIPDDHDVGQGNIWGAGGRKSQVRGGHDGGYVSSVEYVEEVQRAQTSNLPDPFDPTPIQRGISVYYTSLTVGGISFAIIEDRKFKSGPSGILTKYETRPDHVTDPNFDPASIDVPGAVLLGERQLKFLREWGTDWQGAEMKAVLSQTIFCGGAHLHGSLTNRLIADLDSNGWPQSGRNKAISEIRKSFSLMIAGDQHLATIIHHGVDDWNDSGYSMCVPSIANLYLRWWSPLEPGKNREKGAPDYTGEHKDGLGNKITVYAVANPKLEAHNGEKLTTRAAGFGVVKFNKKDRQITMECWPRNVDITDPKTSQYPGWPKTIHQYDNYGRKAIAYLPTLKIKGKQDPVVQIIDESNNEIVYTLRINGKEFTPKVFKKGAYTINVGEGKNKKTFKNVKSTSPNEKPRALSVKL